MNFVTTPSTFGPNLYVRASGDITVGSTGGIDMTKASGTLTVHAEYDCYNTTSSSNAGVITIEDNTAVTASGGGGTLNIFGGDVVIGTTSGTVTATTGTINFVEKCALVESVAIGGSAAGTITGTWKMRIINAELARLTATAVTFTSDAGNLHLTDIVQASTMSGITAGTTLTATAGNIDLESGVGGASSFVSLIATGSTGMSLNQDLSTTAGAMSLTFDTGDLTMAQNVDVTTTGGDLSFASSGNNNIVVTNLPASMQVLSDVNNLDLNFGGQITLNRASGTREMFNLYVGGTLTCSPGGTSGLVLTGAQSPSGTGAIVKIQAGDIIWDTTSGNCAITANDGASSASDFVWILPSCTASGNLECQMILGDPSAHGNNFSVTTEELGTINMNGGSSHGNVILGDVHLNEPITGGIAATTLVDVIQVTNLTLAATVSNNVYVTANRHANAVCIVVLFCVVFWFLVFGSDLVLFLVLFLCVVFENEKEKGKRKSKRH